MYGQKYGPKLVKPLRIEKKQERAKEKPKLGNARRLRRTYCIDLDDEECKEILTKVVAKLEIASEKTPKTVHECIVKSWLQSINAHDEQKRIKLRREAYFEKVRNLHCGTHCQRRSAHPRGGTSVRS